MKDIQDIIDEELSKSRNDLDLLKQYDVNPESIGDYFSQDMSDALSDLMPKSNENKTTSELLIDLAAAYFMSSK